MPNVTLRDVPIDLHSWLKQRAASHHRSVNKEVITARLGIEGHNLLLELLHRSQATIVPCDASLAGAAYEAWLRYGRGRHPAGLNFGDCFAYALAKQRGEPLLFKGDDFAKTDIVAAL
jgi:ribonuclease VapC